VNGDGVPGVMLVTGAASGIGLELATELHRRGHRVVAADLDEPALHARFASRERMEVVRLDVTNPSDWEAAVLHARARFGRLDALLNVAGCLTPGWSHEIPDASSARMIDVNVKGVIFGTNAAARAMLAQAGGSGGQIVNVASLAALVAVPGIAVYSASKHAVRAFSLAVAEELRPHGIAVTAVCPGPVQTPMLDAQLHSDEAAITFSAPRPLTTEEVTRAIVDRALVERPLELVVTVPRSGQAPLARLLNALPNLAPRLSPLIQRIGRRNQRRMRPRG
jgi:NAD(P)-dependent dehydrogenase (short-subunit alcohol dehydrogenase family)